MNEPDNFFAAHSISKDRISSIPIVIELTDELGEVKKTCETHEKRYAMEAS